MIVIDARGLSCPEPVIRLKRVINGCDVTRCDEIRLLVDNPISLETCSRFAASAGFSAQETGLGEGVFALDLRKGRER